MYVANRTHTHTHTHTHIYKSYTRTYTYTHSLSHLLIHILTQRAFPVRRRLGQPVATVAERHSEWSSALIIQKYYKLFKARKAARLELEARRRQQLDDEATGQVRSKGLPPPPPPTPPATAAASTMDGSRSEPLLAPWTAGNGGMGEEDEEDDNAVVSEFM